MDNTQIEMATEVAKSFFRSVGDTALHTCARNAYVPPTAGAATYAATRNAETTAKAVGISAAAVVTTGVIKGIALWAIDR